MSTFWRWGSAAAVTRARDGPRAEAEEEKAHLVAPRLLGEERHARDRHLYLFFFFSRALRQKRRILFLAPPRFPRLAPISRIVTETLEKCDDTGKKKPWPSAAETSGGEQGGADRHHRLLGFQFSRTREAPRASLPFLSFRRGHDDGGDPVDPCR